MQGFFYGMVMASSQVGYLTPVRQGNGLPAQCIVKRVRVGNASDAQYFSCDQRSQGTHALRRVTKTNTGEWVAASPGTEKLTWEAQLGSGRYVWFQWHRGQVPGVNAIRNTNSLSSNGANGNRRGASNSDIDMDGVNWQNGNLDNLNDVNWVGNRSDQGSTIGGRRAPGAGGQWDQQVVYAWTDGSAPAGVSKPGGLDDWVFMFPTLRSVREVYGGTDHYVWKGYDDLGHIRFSRDRSKAPAGRKDTNLTKPMEAYIGMITKKRPRAFTAPTTGVFAWIDGGTELYEFKSETEIRKIYKDIGRPSPWRFISSGRDVKAGISYTKNKDRAPPLQPANSTATFKARLAATYEVGGAAPTLAKKKGAGGVFAWTTDAEGLNNRLFEIPNLSLTIKMYDGIPGGTYRKWQEVVSTDRVNRTAGVQFARKLSNVPANIRNRGGPQANYSDLSAYIQRAYQGKQYKRARRPRVVQKRQRGEGPAGTSGVVVNNGAVGGNNNGGRVVGNNNGGVGNNNGGGVVGNNSGVVLFTLRRMVQMQRVSDSKRFIAYEMIDGNDGSLAAVALRVLPISELSVADTDRDAAMAAQLRADLRRVWELGYRGMPPLRNNDTVIQLMWRLDRAVHGRARVNATNANALRRFYSSIVTDGGQLTTGLVCLSAIIKGMRPVVHMGSPLAHVPQLVHMESMDGSIDDMIAALHTTPMAQLYLCEDNADKIWLLTPQ